MLKSFVTCAVLSGSAAVACAQDGLSSAGAPHAGLAQEAPGAAPASQAAGVGTTVFTAESGARANPGRSEHGGTNPGNQSWLGLAREFGALTVGREYDLQYLGMTPVADSFNGSPGRSADNPLGGGRRSDGSIQYYGPLARGISAGASYNIKEKVDRSPAGRAWGMTVGIHAGPLTVRAAHQNLNAVRVQFNNKTSNDTVARNSILAANLRLGWGTAYAAYSLSRGWAGSPLFNPDNPYGAGLARTASSNSRDVLVGMAVPVGARTTLLTSYVQKDDRDLANQDANQVAIGASHALSRRTDFYAAYSHIRHTIGSARTRGNGNAAFNVGMRHAF